MEIQNEQTCSLENYRLIRETKEYRHTPFGFREHICKDKKITQTAKLVWIVLSDYSVFSSEFKIAMSLRTLATKVGKDKRTARRALEELEKHHYILTNLNKTGKGGEETVIWVRFPNEAAQAILQKPDRKSLRTERNTLQIVQPSNHPAHTNRDQVEIPSESISAAERGIFALGGAKMPESGASMPQGGAPTPPINTNNITDLTITKKTNNNVGTKQGSGINQLQTPLDKLLAVECLFKNFVERANVLKSQDLEPSALNSTLWEPYSLWEKDAIQQFSELKKLSASDWDVATAIAIKSQYDMHYQEAKAAGLSSSQASQQARMQFSKEEIEANDMLNHALAKIGNILMPKEEKALEPVVAHEISPVTTNVISLGLKPKISLTQPQVDCLVKRLQRAYQNAELKGEASQIDLRTLAEQLIFHAEHWSPSSIEYKTTDERVNIAISVAIKRMKAGNWSAPYGWAKQLSLSIEQSAEQAKKRERVMA